MAWVACIYAASGRDFFLDPTLNRTSEPKDFDNVVPVASAFANRAIRLGIYLVIYP